MSHDQSRRSNQANQANQVVPDGKKDAGSESPLPSRGFSMPPGYWQHYGMTPPAGGVQRAVRTAGGGAPSGESVHRAAAEGTSGAAGQLPHLDAIQRSFGRHDVSEIKAHTDSAAATGAAAMGAEAFAAGDHVAFAGAPGLFTA